MGFPGTLIEIRQLLFSKSQTSPPERQASGKFQKFSDIISFYSICIPGAQMTKKRAESPKNSEKPSVLQSLFNRPEKDAEYMSDLQGQWDGMSKSERVKFVAGAVLALVLFIGALVGVFAIISYLRNLVF